MKITPTIQATRFSQLQPGELFLLGNGAATVAALAAKDPARDGDMVMVVLGGGIAPNMVGRILDPQYMDVMSFGTDFEVRLPSRPEGWSIEPPSAEKLCVVLVASGQSEQRLFLKANFSPDTVYRPCYVDMNTGYILTALDQTRLRI